MPIDLSTEERQTRIDYKLANLLQGDHPITGPDHERRVVQLEELIILRDATDKAGWARHTGDWDWFVTITHEGIEYPQYHPQPADADTNYDEFAMGMGFDFTNRPDNFVACVDYNKVTHITLDYDIPDDQTDGEHTIQLDINHITNIRWEQA